MSKSTISIPPEGTCKELLGNAISAFGNLLQRKVPNWENPFVKDLPSPFEAFIYFATVAAKRGKGVEVFRKLF